jgi:prepilin-type processing-associated H-X9-DG protein
VPLPAYFFSWSTLAQLNPYLEQTNIYNKMDLSLPIYDPMAGYNISVPNQFAVQQVVKIFLCPSDKAPAPAGGYGVPVLGPTNYAACIGSGNVAGGATLGSPWGSDGMFSAQIGHRVTDVTDGTSNTAMMSESTIGEGPESASGPIPGKPQKVYAYLNAGTPLSESACAGATRWNVERRRGFLWATGELRCATYNHYYLPNAPTWDCITNDYTPGVGQYTAIGFRAARSQHSGGVNLLLGDGSVRFVRDSVTLAVWRSAATRDGGEVPGDF